MFHRAERRKARLRLAILGPSGSGKTYSSLLIAFGLGGKVAMLDTERGSGELYAHLGEYDVAQPAFFHPREYIKIIKGAEAAGYNVLVIDSLSHAWAGSGGLLEEVDKRRGSGNDFAAWRNVTPEHNALVEAMLQSPMHIIATMRTKQEYVLEEVVKNGRTVKVPKKVGLQPVQRDGLEYEFTCVLDVDLDRHMASASKDRTGLFDGQLFTITQETGHNLLAWLESGTDTPPPPPVPQFQPINMEMVKERFDLCAARGDRDGLVRELKALAIPDGHPQRQAVGELYKTTLANLNFMHSPVPGADQGEQQGQQEPQQPSGEEPADSSGKLTAPQRKAIQAHFSKEFGKDDREGRLAAIGMIIGREIKSTNDLTMAEAHMVMEYINNNAQQGHKEAA